jgi:hypothetical protein
MYPEMYNVAIDYLIGVLVLHLESALSLSHIHGPFTLVPDLLGSGSLVFHFTKAVPLAQPELALVDVAISVHTLPAARDLAIGEFALVAASVTEEQHPLALLGAVLVLPLVLEVGILIGVDTLTVAEFGHRVQVSHIAVLRIDVVVLARVLELRLNASLGAVHDREGLLT